MKLPHSLRVLPRCRPSSSPAPRAARSRQREDNREVGQVIRDRGRRSTTCGHSAGSLPQANSSQGQLDTVRLHLPNLRIRRRDGVRASRGSAMPDYYEIDFLPVHTSKSGDAIAMRYQIGANWWVHVVDGGFTSTAADLAAHVWRYYGTNLINRVVVTHPDQDHAEGLTPILEDFTVEELWMLRPWDYVDVLLPHFSRYTSAKALKDRLRDDYPYIEELERIAHRKGIPILEPFQGARIGPFTVLAPSRLRYFQLILQSERTPQLTPQMRSIVDALMKPIAPIISFIKAGWGSEKFSTEETSVENEMSLVQYALLNGHKIVLTLAGTRLAKRQIMRRRQV
jgi:hypothetical protein